MKSLRLNAIRGLPALLAALAVVAFFAFTLAAGAAAARPAWRKCPRAFQ